MVCPGHDASPEPSPAQFFCFPTSHWSAAGCQRDYSSGSVLREGQSVSWLISAEQITLAPSYSGRPPRVPFTLGWLYRGKATTLITCPRAGALWILFSSSHNCPIPNFYIYVVLIFLNGLRLSLNRAFDWIWPYCSSNWLDSDGPRSLVFKVDHNYS